MKSTLLDKSFRILERITLSKEPVTLKELAADLNLNTSTVSRITSDLAERNLIRKAGYHSFVPSTGMFKLGQSAFDTPLLRAVETLLNDRGKELSADVTLASIEFDRMLFLYKDIRHASDWLNGKLPPWRSPLAAVILAKEGDPEKAERFFQTVISDEKNKINAAQEIHYFRNQINAAKKSGNIIFKDPRIGWSINFPVSAAGQFFGLSISGKDVDKCNIDRMFFECSRLASRLTSLVDSLFY